MSLSIIIADPEINRAKDLKSFLTEKKFDVEISDNGKLTQSLLYKKKSDFVVIDLSIKDHSCFEVLRYIKLNAPEVQVIITANSKEELLKIEVSEADLLRFGASLVLYRPLTPESIFKNIEKDYKIESWRDHKAYEGSGQAEQIVARDTEFTRIKFENFLSGSTSIFDYYLRLAKDKYVKILHEGESFEKSRIKKFEVSSLEYLYFKTSDRANYISYTNTLLAKIIGKNASSIEKRINLAQNLVEKFLEQIYSTGIRPSLIEDGKMICENMSKMIHQEEDLSRIYNNYSDYDPPVYAHLFMTSFFSILVCKNLDWAGNRTIEIVALGALLHDIGKVKLPIVLREKHLSMMTPEEIALYKTHPRLGADLLSKFNSIPEPVKQIVFQHHEHNDGTGYPNNLPGNKIYPMAKIVSLCDSFSNFLIQNKLSPLPGLRSFITEKSMISLHDPNMIRALIASFRKEKK